MQTTKNEFLAAQSGDQAAYNRLFARVEARALAFARQHVFDSLMRETSPEDVLQEAYLEAHLNFSSFEYRQEDAFLLWLCGIVRRVIQMHARAIDTLKRQPVPIPRPDPTGLSTMLDRPEQAKKLYAALVQLPDKMRRVLTDCFFLERTAADVGREIGESEDNVWQLKARAIKKMRELLQ